MQLEITVEEGPDYLIGNSAFLFPTMATSGVLIRSFGRMDLLSMFGDFPGIEMVSRTHLLMTFDTNSEQVNVRDPGSKNGSSPLSATINDIPQRVRIADVITISLVVSEFGNENFPPSSNSKEDLIRYINDSVRSFTDSVGWSFQMRKSWNSMGKNEVDLTVDELEWKIIPSDEELRRRGWAADLDSLSSKGSYQELEGHEDGLFYVLSRSSLVGSFGIEHSNDRTLPSDGDVAQWVSTMTMIPFSIISSGSGDKLFGQWSKGTLTQYIRYICGKFECNHYRNS